MSEEETDEAEIAGEEIPPEETRPGLWEDLRALPRAYWILFAGVFVNRFGSFVVPFLVFYFADRGFPESTAAIGITAYGLGGLAAVGFAGVLADAVGRRNTLCLSMFSTAVVIVFMSRAGSIHMLIALAAVVGFAQTMAHPAVSALLADLVPPRLRIRAYATLRVAVNFGFACGGVAGGFLATVSWDLLFWCDAATCVAYGLIAIFFLPHGIRTSRKEAGWAKAIPVIAKDRPFIAVVVSNFFAAVILWQINSTFAVKVKADFNPQVYGWLLAINGLMIVLLEIPLTGITGRFKPRHTMAVGYLLCGFGLASIAISDSLFVLAFAMAVLTLGEMTYMPVSGAHVAGLAHEKMRGRYMGAFGLSWSVAIILGPLAGMLVYSWNPSAVWLGCGFLGIIAASVIVFTGKEEAEEAEEPDLVAEIPPAG